MDAVTAKRRDLLKTAALGAVGFATHEKREAFHGLLRRTSELVQLLPRGMPVGRLLLRQQLQRDLLAVIDVRRGRVLRVQYEQQWVRVGVELGIVQLGHHLRSIAPIQIRVADRMRHYRVRLAGRHEWQLAAARGPHAGFVHRSRALADGRRLRCDREHRERQRVLVLGAEVHPRRHRAEKENQR